MTHLRQLIKEQAPALVLVALLVGFRIVSLWYGEANFQPLTGLTFCAIAVIGWRAAWVPLSAWLISYLIMPLFSNYPLGWDLLASVMGFGVVAFLGWKWQTVTSFGGRLLGAATGSVLFYLLANAVSWLTLPQYGLTVEGFMQAQWFGLPQWGPTWVFLRSMLSADLLFTSLFLLALKPYENKVPSALCAE